jgi:hypothetical protein
MARKAKTDRELQSGKIRLAKVKSVDATLKMNDEVSVANLEATINQGQAALEDYNQTWASLDGKDNLYKSFVKKANDISERLLESVGVKYGKDSNEYEMAGGTRKSERKKPVRKTALKA